MNHPTTPPVRTSRRRPATAILPSLLVLLALCPQQHSAWAAEREEFPEDFPGPPNYARLEPVENGFHDGVWAAIPFYRDPEGIPEDFNLMEFRDRPRAWSVPLTVEGFVIRDTPRPSPPKHFYAQELPGMPVWFVLWDELREAMFDDGVLTIVDLLEMESLEFGVAELYVEEIQPLGRDTPSSHRIITFGELWDGTPFWAMFAHGASGQIQVQIEFR